MASRDFKAVKALERAVVIIGGRIAFTNGTMTGVSEGIGFTCSDMSSGVFTVTLDDVNGAKTLSFVCNDHSDDDVTGDSDNDQEIQFIAFLKNSSVT